MHSRYVNPNSTRIRKALPGRTLRFALAGAAYLLLTGVAGAAPVHSLLHNADALGNTSDVFDFIEPQAAPINYSFNGFTDFQERNTGIVEASTNQGQLAISATASNNGLPVSQRQEVTARFGFDVIFGSSGSTPIDVLMNMDISGIINPGAFIYSTVQVEAGLTTGARSTGGYSESTTEPLMRSGMLSGFVDDGSEQSISTSAITVPVNVPVEMFMSLKTIQAYLTNAPSIDFGSTLTLASLGDVFTILGGADITVNSEDAGIVDNRFGAPSAVPIPAALPLFTAGLALLAFFGRVGRRSPAA